MEFYDSIAMTHRLGFLLLSGFDDQTSAFVLLGRNIQIVQAKRKTIHDQSKRTLPDKRWFPP